MGFANTQPALVEGPSTAGQLRAAPLSTSWCERAGAKPLAQDSVMIQIAYDYLASVGADCRTSGLTETMSALQFRHMEDYLFDYGSALAGCKLRNILPGGVEAFGPGNTAVVGVNHPPLGRDDAGALIGRYLDVFAPALALAVDERNQVEELLWNAAQPIDPTAPSILSRCESAADSL